ncbi:DUF3071 domain-containing protein [Nocardioides sp. zg-536]|uniref:DUF3071 domain-containing protein n=1 Tax=Nocardioides faecalis TaxID=2803858 RepID=A0A939BWG8_9ACTN|nr:septation protein SepH [Nocardioides faecalis]MBM9460557.1 DUF3071 domain-containing protein [Nocardioides faecalis]MBS4754380.1 DUF3071 domain-containing protein [Nocardioides faecalis]QVI57513.1 DUF3071 domain-containing protein [Nocardioides faecalis]
MADETEQAASGPTRLVLADVVTDRRLLLVDDEGTEFSLEITPDLRAAVRGGAPRRLEINMSSSIRPREIQNRIRAGESAETVAAAAGTTVEAIMAYVGPVLAEREHVAQRAQRASVRRTPGESTATGTQTRALGDAVAAHLRELGADPTEVEWDAYRRETGRWVLTGTFAAAQRSGTARFTYDAPGNYVLADNDDARWLIGDAVAPVARPEARDDLRSARERRLNAVPLEDVAAQTPAVEPPVAEPPAAQPPAQSPAAQSPAAQSPAAQSVAPAGLDEELPFADDPLRATAAPAASEQTAEQAEEERAEAERARHRRAVQKKRGRASVPSWDEIMFGGGDQG